MRLYCIYTEIVHSIPMEKSCPIPSKTWIGSCKSNANCNKKCRELKQAIRGECRGIVFWECYCYFKC